jgi:hypothetical protein
MYCASRRAAAAHLVPEMLIVSSQEPPLFQWQSSRRGIWTAQRDTSVTLSDEEGTLINIRSNMAGHVPQRWPLALSYELTASSYDHVSISGG